MDVAADSALELAPVPRVYFDYLATYVSASRPQSAGQIAHGILNSAFHRYALGDIVTIRSFVTNFNRIRVGLVRAGFDRPEDIAISRWNVGKERAYALNCRYSVRTGGTQAKIS